MLHSHGLINALDAICLSEYNHSVWSSFSAGRMYKCVTGYTPAKPCLRHQNHISSIIQTYVHSHTHTHTHTRIGTLLTGMCWYIYIRIHQHTTYLTLNDNNVSCARWPDATCWHCCTIFPRSNPEITHNSAAISLNQREIITSVPFHHWDSHVL